MAQNEVTSACRLLVIGGSAGSLEVLLEVLPNLRANLPFPILIVMHRKSAVESTLEELLATRTRLKVKEAEDKEILCDGVIYVAPADYHLLVEKNGTLSLDYSEKIHYCRPAIDVTFETAADTVGNRLVCLLLSGANADGASGLRKAAAAGALPLIQDPASADMNYMPAAGLAAVRNAKIVAVEEMATLINNLAQ
ncbi:MAG: chemotaxis protein CheB [Flaviaesturariibacter sp.]|nr:chemotaxis protein CheB [Flaviaesturariibacter sp.]